jgi:hypothetical protein
MIVQFTRYRAHSAAAPPTATQVVLTTQPGGAVEDASFTTQPVGEIRSAGDVKVSGSTAAVTATLTSGSGALIGTTTVNAVAGVFTFAGLGVDTAGMGCVITFSASGLTSAVSSSFEVEEEDDGVTVLFADDFSSGNLSHSENDIEWTPANTDVATVSVARTGTKCVRFRFGATATGEDANAELRFGGLPNLPEVYLQYYLYYPSGAESPSVGPKFVTQGPENDKFFRIWGVTEEDYGTLPGLKFGASTFGTVTDDNVLAVEYYYSPPGDPDAMWAMGRGNAETGDDTDQLPFLNDSRRGRWIQIRIRVKAATAANNDGVVQIWVDGVLLTSYTALKAWPGVGRPNTFTHGYILGYENNGADTDQIVYLADVAFSTGGFPS